MTVSTLATSAARIPAPRLPRLPARWRAMGVAGTLAVAAAVLAPAAVGSVVLFLGPVALLALLARAGDQLDADTLRIVLGVPQPLR